MNEKIKALKSAFPYTIPVLLGYLFIGFAFGILLANQGYSFWWAILMCGVIYAGTMQYVAVGFFAGGIGLVNIVFISLMINIRNVFYGLSMIDKFKGTGKLKPYMIFSLTDETYSLLCLTEPPKGVDRKYFMFFIAFLNQLYWTTGSFIGAVAGSLITFNAEGIDFAMTALFVVIAVEQWLFVTTHIPAITGIIATVLCLILFGKDNFLLPSMILIMLVLTVLRKNIESKISIDEEEITQ